MTPLLLASLALLVAGAVTQSDVDCLREFKSSVHTAGEYLQSWDFGSNSSQPNICDFIGVQCLHPSEMKVYSLSLPGAGLQGSFPKGLEKCTSLTGLDLSGNAFTGPIPANICQTMPYLVKLDLSQNNITGSIPEGLSSCIYLNEIRLQRNQLEGGIPGQIGLLNRLREFDVANNQLTGAIPYTFSAAATSTAPNAHSAGFPASDFEGNEGLCGPPLQRECRPAGGQGSGAGGGGAAAAGRRTKTGAAVVAGVAVGGTVAMLAASSICIWLTLERLRSLKAGSGGASDDAALLDNSWLRRLNPATVVVSMFEQPLVKMKLSDLAAATGGFSKEAVIGLGRSGVCYKASLRDGSILAVKRLRPTLGGGEKQFRSEMESLAKARHRNLVPMLGYVAAGGERLLVYKHMANGSLADRLHGSGTVTDSSTLTTMMDWPTRLKVAVGAARGLAWMHHSCQPKLVHRCLSSSTILLDEDMEPRITDFGLAKLLGGGRSAVSPEARHYIAPEETTTYSSSTATSSAAGSTAKGDVYAFGVVLLELVTGRRPSDGGGNGDSAATSTPARRSLVEWIGDLFKTGHVSDSIDPRLIAAEAAAVAAAATAMDGCVSDNSSSGSGRRREVMQVLKIACSCVLSFPKERPSMYEVYHMLRGVGEDFYSCPRPPAPLQQQQQQRLRLRQLDDDGDIAAASAALARSAADEESRQGDIEMKRLDAMV